MILVLQCLLRVRAAAAAAAGGATAAGGDVVFRAAARLHSERAAAGGDMSVKMSWGKTQEAAALMCVMNIFPDSLLEEVRGLSNRPPPPSAGRAGEWVRHRLVSWTCFLMQCLKL
jgi:hypothetical protein